MLDCHIRYSFTSVSDMHVNSMNVAVLQSAQ